MLLDADSDVDDAADGDIGDLDYKWNDGKGGDTANDDVSYINIGSLACWLAIGVCLLRPEHWNSTTFATN